MCGLAGFSFGKSFQPKPEQLRALTAILISEMDCRGGDSWGAVIGKELRIEKGLGYGLKMTGGFDLSLITKAKQLMFHTRKATVGDKTVENAHPFEAGNIIGSHNGSIRNFHELNHKLNLGLKVDSNIIFTFINNGWDLSELQGHGAITYINREEPNNIRLAKFHGGTLHAYGLRIGDVKEGEPDWSNIRGVVWASTDAAVRLALGAAGLGDAAFAYSEPPMGGFCEVHDGILYKVGREPKECNISSVITVVDRRRFNQHGWNNVDDKPAWPNEKGDLKPLNLIEHKNKQKETKVIDLTTANILKLSEYVEIEHEDFSGPYRGDLSALVFKQGIKEDCQWCNSVESAKIHYVPWGVNMCKACYLNQVYSTEPDVAIPVKLLQCIKSDICDRCRQLATGVGNTIVCNVCAQTVWHELIIPHINNYSKNEEITNVSNLSSLIYCKACIKGLETNKDFELCLDCFGKYALTNTIDALSLDFESRSKTIDEVNETNTRDNDYNLEDDVKDAEILCDNDGCPNEAMKRTPDGAWSLCNPCMEGYKANSMAMVKVETV